jgi:hypothetical protein
MSGISHVFCLCGVRGTRAVRASVLDALQRADFDAAAARERERGLGRRPLRIERGLDRRSALFDRAVRLPLDQAPHAHREPSRRGEALDGAVSERRGIQALGDAVGK